MKWILLTFLILIVLLVFFGTLYSIKKENEVWIRERDKNGKWKYTLDREKKWYE